jgi:hypothetical protein
VSDPANGAFNSARGIRLAVTSPLVDGGATVSASPSHSVR